MSRTHGGHGWCSPVCKEINGNHRGSQCLFTAERKSTKWSSKHTFYSIIRETWLFMLTCSEQSIEKEENVYSPCAHLCVRISAWKPHCQTQGISCQASLHPTPAQTEVQREGRGRHTLPERRGVPQGTPHRESIQIDIRCASCS